MEINRTEDSDSNIEIRTKIYRAKLFYKLYWRIIVIIGVPLILLPVAFIENGPAYKCFYVFLVTSTYWVSDAMHPTLVSFIPMVLSYFIKVDTMEVIGGVFIWHTVINTMTSMIFIIAMEHSGVHKRIALKILLIFGCSHYRLSFLLFVFCMFLSLWVSTTLACGIMMPIVKAVLTELEMMGILELFHTVKKKRRAGSLWHELDYPKPTDFTTFYFLGIAYSSSIGGQATLIASRTNLVFKEIFERTFPIGPKIQFPHIMLLNLPGILVMQLFLYLWMNFYFLGRFRGQSDIALQIGLSDEEAQYIHTLLSTEYTNMSKITFHETMVVSVLCLAMFMQAIAGSFHNYINVPTNMIVCVSLLFILPTTPDFLKFFKKSDGSPNLPSAPSKACLNWTLVSNQLEWGVLFVIGGSCVLFNALRTSGMTSEFEKFLLLFSGLPAPALTLVVIMFSKVLAEFGSNIVVVHTLLPCIANVSIKSRQNPLYLMLSTTMAGALPFHLSTGTSANAMVAAYVHIPPWKMLRAGVGPSSMAVLALWFTVCLWSQFVWLDSDYQEWSNVDILMT